MHALVRQGLTLAWAPVLGFFCLGRPVCMGPTSAYELVLCLGTGCVPATVALRFDANT